MSFMEVVSPIEEIIEVARNGRMFILVDDQEREDEGDLVIPAQMATPEIINFMAKHGRGLICPCAAAGAGAAAASTAHEHEQRHPSHTTAFTVSIEAREGVTTGISAPDRARTIAAAIDPTKGADDIVTPGHIFPLMARSGGVLVRAGHTEAAVDVARLAGLNASGVICEIMNDDGTMARRDDLIRFAQLHGLKIATIADLIAYRRRHERTIHRGEHMEIHTRHGGDFQMILYVDEIVGSEHVALVKGDIGGPKPVMVRVHALNILDDVLGNKTAGRGGELQAAMEMIGREGRGVVVLIREPRVTSISERVRAIAAGAPDATGHDLRDYGIGAQILLDLGVHEMILLSNTKRSIVGMDGYGLSVAEQRPVCVP